MLEHKQEACMLLQKKCVLVKKKQQNFLPKKKSVIKKIAFFCMEKKKSHKKYSLIDFHQHPLFGKIDKISLWCAHSCIFQV